MGERLRVAVVGGGLIAQAAHLPNLRGLDALFDVVALVEPRAEVAGAVARRWGIPRVHASIEELLAEGGADAALVCTPATTHADVAVACLDAGLHVLCEKPLCVTLEEADRICAARERSGRVVQVGYMKRFDPAVEALYDDLPDTTEALRYVSVVAHDPEEGPYFGDGELVRGEPGGGAVPAAREATGVSGDPVAMRTFLDGYLGSLVHFVNLVHGALERMGEPLPTAVAGSRWWAGGEALTASCTLAGGAAWDSAWIQLRRAPDHRERVVLYFDDAIRTLDFPSPWLHGAATVYERAGADARGARVATSVRSHREAFVAELRHFHACVTGGEPCRTPPEQARTDVEALTAMFRAATPTTTEKGTSR
jgi:predicted dehydrogenase